MAVTNSKLWPENDAYTQSAICVGSSITRACGRITSSDRPYKPWYDRHTAKERTKQMVNGYDVELWHRKIATFQHKGPTST
jgi:hypothetical protein